MSDKDPDAALSAPLARLVARSRKVVAGSGRLFSEHFVSFVNNQRSTIPIFLTIPLIRNTRLTHRLQLFFNMSDQNGTTMSGTETVNASESVTAPKGKGKAADATPQEVSMGEDDDSSDEETGAEEDVWIPQSRLLWFMAES